MYNNIITDNFYMKGFFINDAQANSNQSYGNVAIGPTFRFVVTGYTSD